MLAVLLWGSGPAECRGDGDGKAAKLRTQIAQLKTQLVERDTRIRQLEDNVEQLAMWISLPKAVAFSGSRHARENAALSPSSTLNEAKAITVGRAATLIVPGAFMSTVLPTGSMQPLISQQSLLLLEPAKFEDLRVGDIVSYWHRRLGQHVVHRITERKGDNFWSKGDNNGRMDDEYITRENYQARVFGIIYANDALAPDPPKTSRR